MGSFQLIVAEVPVGAIFDLVAVRTHPATANDDERFASIFQIMSVWRSMIVPPLRMLVQPLRRHWARRHSRYFFSERWPFERSGDATFWDCRAVRLSGAQIDFSKGTLDLNDGAPGSGVVLETGFLQVPRPPDAVPVLPLHLAVWLRSLARKSNGVLSGHHTLGVAVCRYEERNLFHAMTEVYNTWLLLRFLSLPPEEATILMVDDRPPSPMDGWFRTLFRSQKHARAMVGIHSFGTLLLGLPGYQSPLHPRHQLTDHGAADFCRYVLGRFGVEERRSGNVGEILIVSRPPVDACGRRLGRRIANEAGLVEAVQQVFPFARVEAVDLESLGLREQLERIAKTDLLIGMHGAGLTHALFLPVGSRVLELFPKFLSPTNDHYRNICLWRKLTYQRWQNLDSNRELDARSTAVDLVAVRRRLESLR